MSSAFPSNGDRAAIEECRERALALLAQNSTAIGIAAAAAGESASARHYDAVFARDASICALGMALSGAPQLQRQALDGLLSLAEHQAPNGQLPNFVAPANGAADFWYLGCIDATLWWLVAVDFLDVRTHPGLRQRLQTHIDAAIHWLHCQEHPEFHLLVQNEASDWADIMPRSGFVLYGNALWYHVKGRYGLADRDATQASFNRLFHPSTAQDEDGRRGRVLREYVTRRGSPGVLYLSFVNFSFWGEEGDVFGNLLALLFGLADDVRARGVLDALMQAGVHRPYPVRAVVTPILRGDRLWRDYMLRHRQNRPWQYHNGGIWPFIGAFWVLAVARWHGRAAALVELALLARANRLQGWQFNEWLHGRTGRARGMPRQSWNAAAFLLAHAAIDAGAEPSPDAFPLAVHDAAGTA